ncbi:MAG: sirohydrochlorin cobaltochelatase [Planctomycetota bacterium]|nr:sirohydrochlorin cobaltochelatase [Planctomycetota bacterium]
MAEKRRAILLVDHGSVRAEANDVLHEIARLVSGEAPSFHVEVAHMELAEPTIAQGFSACVAAGAEEVIVQPYLLAPGRHAQDDIPRLVEEAARQHQGVEFRVTAPLGVDRRLAQLIVERVKETDGRD